MNEKYREEVTLWLEDAKDSLHVADRNYGDNLYHVAVFYCQQSLEKALKGLILHYTRRHPPKTHNLLALYRKIERFARLPAVYQDFLRTITPYYSITRYVDAAIVLPKEAVTKTFARQCIASTRKILDLWGVI